LVPGINGVEGGIGASLFGQGDLGSFGPDEELGLSVVVIEIVADSRFQFGDAGCGAAL